MSRIKKFMNKLPDAIFFTLLIISISIVCTMIWYGIQLSLSYFVLGIFSGVAALALSKLFDKE